MFQVFWRIARASFSGWMGWASVFLLIFRVYVFLMISCIGTDVYLRLPRLVSPLQALVSSNALIGRIRAQTWKESNSKYAVLFICDPHVSDTGHYFRQAVRIIMAVSCSFNCLRVISLHSSSRSTVSGNDNLHLS